MNKTHVAVIGGGCAGLSAAAALAQHGIKVSLFEGSHTLGGRARTIDAKNRHFSQVLDNGQHILLGAYSQTLALLTQVGINPNDVFLRLPLNMHMLDSTKAAAFSLKSADYFPAPLNLLFGFLCSKGLSLADRMAAIGFMLQLKKIRYQIANDLTLAEFLTAHKQSKLLIKLLWEPLCLAALNTPVASASTRVFLRVLRDSFSGCKQNSDFLLPRLDLSQTLAHPAAAYIAGKGGCIATSSRVDSVQIADDSFSLHMSQVRSGFSHVVIATAPNHAAKLLAPHAVLERLSKDIGTYSYQPIYTVYLQYAANIALPRVMTGLVNSTAQWVFDRGQLCGQPGLIAVIVSAEGPHQSLNHDALSAKVIAELNHAFPALGQPLWQQVIAEKRATFTCTPDLVRPDHTTPIKGLYIAGDYTYKDYPATIEGAVRSGAACATLIAKDIRTSRNALTTP